METRDPFSLIEKANRLESSNDLWGAASAFSEAAHVLRSLSIEETQEKIAELYLEQWRDYLKKSRDVFIAALLEEMKNDIHPPPSAPGKIDTPPTEVSPMCTCESLSVSEKERRMLTFRRIFVDTDPDTLELANEKKQLSLEERLAALNTSLPDEETKRRQRLENLGVYLPPSMQEENKPIVPVVPKVSQQQQVESLLSLAKDEAMVLNPTTTLPAADVPKKVSEKEQVDSLLSLAKEETTMGPKDVINIQELSEEEQMKLIIEKAKQIDRMDENSHSSRDRSSSERDSSSFDDESSISVLSV